MNKLLVALFLFSFVTGHASEGEYTIRTKINNPKHYTIGIGYFSGDHYVIDTSATLENGWLVFRGKVAEPVVASLFVRRDPALSIKVDRGFIPGPSLNFFIGNETVTIQGEADLIYMASVTGGQANTDWNQIRAQENRLIRDAWLELKQAYEQSGGDKATLEKAGKNNETSKQAQEALRREFVSRNPNSLTSMYFLTGMVNTCSLEELKKLYDAQGDDYKNSSYARSVAQKISSSEATAVGHQAIPLNKKDMNGNPVDLSTLRGKYVLLDFWGSWCGPCRQSHPHLKELYAQYKDRGLEIVGIAEEQSEDLERNRKTWKEAVAADGLPWISVLNNEGKGQFDAVKEYGVSAFPTRVLLDKEGVVIARWVGEEADLDSKLKEIFPAGTTATSGDGIQFSHATWNEVLAQAKQTNRLVFIDVYTSWCGPCKMMASEIFPKKEVGDLFNNNFIPWKLDAEKGEGIAIAAKFGVRAYPTYLFVNGDGELVYKTLGYMPAPAFLKEAQVALKEKEDPMPFLKWEAAYNSGKRDKDFLLGYLKKRAMLKMPSAELIEQVFPLLTKDDLASKETWAALITHDPDAQYLPQGKFFDYVLKNQAMLDSQGLVKYAGGNLENGINTYFNKRVIQEKNAALLPVMQQSEKKLMIARKAGAQEIKTAEKELAMRYYSGTRNEEKFSAAVTDYVRNGLMAQDLAGKKKADSLGYAKFMEPYLKGDKDSATDATYAMMARLSRSQEMLSVSYSLRTAAEDVYDLSTSPALLRQATEWARLANSWFPHFSSGAVYAGLLFKTGRQSEAITTMEAAAADPFLKDRKEVKELMEANAADMRNGKAPENLWKVKQTVTSK